MKDIKSIIANTNPKASVSVIHNFDKKGSCILYSKLVIFMVCKYFKSWRFIIITETHASWARYSTMVYCVLPCMVSMICNQNMGINTNKDLNSCKHSSIHCYVFTKQQWRLSLRQACISYTYEKVSTNLHSNYLYCCDIIF